MGTFVGRTRFSLFTPNSKAWLASQNKDEELYKRQLFSEERLSPRADVFFNISLPQIQLAVQNHQVKHIVDFSPELPEKYRDLLLEAQEKYDWLLLNCQTEDGVSLDTYDVAHKILEPEAAAGDASVFGSYRLDDDDVLPVSYFDRMSDFLVTSNVGFYVSLGRGVTGIQQGLNFSWPRDIKHRMCAIGLLSICQAMPNGRTKRPDLYKTHMEPDLHAPTIVDSRELGFFWNRSFLQDTAIAHQDRETAENSHRRAMSRIPVSNSAEVERQFPVLYQRTLAPVKLTYQADKNQNKTINFIQNPSFILFVVEMNNLLGVKERNALFSLNVRKKDGTVILEEDEKILAKFGINKSVNKDINFFVYIDTKTIGVSATKVQVVLPTQFVLESATLKTWGESGNLNILGFHALSYV